MSKQPLKVVQALRKQKLLLPYNHQDMRQCWLLVRQDPTPEGPGCFFVTHSKNFSKFDKKGFEILGHGFDRAALTMAARRATLECGPAYQPKFSAHWQGLLPSDDGEEPPPEEAPEEETKPLGITKPDPSMLN